MSGWLSVTLCLGSVLNVNEWEEVSRQLRQWSQEKEGNPAFDERRSFAFLCVALLSLLWTFESEVLEWAFFFQFLNSWSQGTETVCSVGVVSITLCIDLVLVKSSYWWKGNNILDHRALLFCPWRRARRECGVENGEKGTWHEPTKKKRFPLACVADVSVQNMDPSILAPIWIPIWIHIWGPFWTPSLGPHLAPYFFQKIRVPYFK